jgi:hypothetical protein
MELDDLKNTWDDLQNKADKQQEITLKMIDKMTQTKYNNRMKSIAYPEIIGTIVCFIGAVYMVVNFNKLNTIFLQSLGVTVLLLLLILPTISLTLLWQFNKTGDVGQPYAETLKKFAAQKIRFYKFQKISALLSYILMVAFIILMPRFFGGRSLNDNKYFWTLAIPLGYIFLYFFSKWALKSYKKTLDQSEELLRELQS